MAMHPASVMQRFQSVFGRLKAQRQIAAAIAAIIAAVLILILIGPFAEDLSDRLARVISELDPGNRPFGLWTLSYIGELLLGFFFALIMSLQKLATSPLFVPLLAAIGIAWLAAK